MERRGLGRELGPGCKGKDSRATALSIKDRGQHGSDVPHRDVSSVGQPVVPGSNEGKGQSDSTGAGVGTKGG